MYPAPTIETPAQQGGKPRQVRINLRNRFTKEDVRTLTSGNCVCTDSSGKTCKPSHAGHGGKSDDCTCVNEDGVTCHYFDFNVTNLHAHGGLLLAWPSIPLVAIGLWWSANTISHNFIHRPFFRMRDLNRAFSCYLSFLLGFPQSLWRARHLAHHGARDRSQSRLAPLDFGASLSLWGALFVFAPRFALTVYLPGYLAGLGLCFL